MYKINKLLKEIEKDYYEMSHFYFAVPSRGDKLHRNINNLQEDEKGNADDSKHKIEILRGNFRPIPASPRNGGLYRKAYCYPKSIPASLKAKTNLFNSPFTLSHAPEAINDPDVSPSELAKSMAHESKTLRSDFRSSECHILSGERGVGKTAFLNYIFSTQHSIFDNNKIIWVRVDLTLAQGLTLSIREFLDIQTYDIIASRYLNGGQFPVKEDFFDDEDYDHAFEQYTLRSQEFSADKLKEYIKERIENFGPNDQTDYWSYLLSLESDKIRSKDICYEEKIKRVSIYRNFILSKDYSFIYIVDGLDEATIPMQKANILKRWRSNIFDIMQGRGVPEGLYLICARFESFRSITDTPEYDDKIVSSYEGQYIEHIEHLQNQSVSRDLRQWIVFPVNTGDILKQRLELFEARITRSEKKYGVKDWTPGSAELVVDLTLYAISETFKEIGINGDPLDTFSQSGHMRSVLKFFRDALWETVAILNEQKLHPDMLIPGLAEFLTKNPTLQKTMRDLLKKKYYRIWAISSLNYLNYYECSINYDREENKLLYPSKVGEFPLVPSVWGDVEFEKEDIYFNNHLLSKVRILQLLNQNNSHTIKFKDIKTIISSVFQKDPQKIDILIKASILQRLIDFDMTQEALTPLEESKLKLTDLGRAIIENWIYIPNYIEYTMHLAAVPDILIDEFPKFYPARASGPLAGKEDFEYLKSSDYIAKLFPIISKWISLVAAVEIWEFTRFKLYRKLNKINPMPENITFKFEPIIDIMVKECYKSAKRIILTEQTKEASKIIEKLSAIYFKHSAN